jgi:hypothetical protein
MPSTTPFSDLDKFEDARLAFRLLCEAKQSCADSPSASLQGFVIHAPSNDLEQWMNPFSLSSSDTKDKIAELADMMGNKKAQAKTVLEALQSKDSAGIATAVANFLK